MSEARSLALAYDLASRHGDGEIVTAILQAAGEWLAVQRQRDAALDLLRRLVAAREEGNEEDWDDGEQVGAYEAIIRHAPSLLATIDGTPTTETEG